jgi:hypothetical protein
VLESFTLDNDETLLFTLQHFSEHWRRGVEETDGQATPQVTKFPF